VSSRGVFHLPRWFICLIEREKYHGEKPLTVVVLIIVGCIDKNKLAQLETVNNCSG
jgi:hypothetical protein